MENVIITYLSIALDIALGKSPFKSRNRLLERIVDVLVLWIWDWKKGWGHRKHMCNSTLFEASGTARKVDLGKTIL